MKLVDLLIADGPDLNKTDHGGRTSLYAGTLNSQFEAVDDPILSGAGPNKSIDDGCTFIYSLVDSAVLMWSDSRS